MENDWISVEDRYPEKGGIYRVKMHTGSMSPKIIERDSKLTIYPNNRCHFQGEVDWDYVSHWKEKE